MSFNTLCVHTQVRVNLEKKRQCHYIARGGHNTHTHTHLQTKLWLHLREDRSPLIYIVHTHTHTHYYHSALDDQVSVLMSAVLSLSVCPF